MDDHSEDNPWPAFADLLGASTLLFIVLFAVIAIPSLQKVGNIETTVEDILASLQGSQQPWRANKVGDYVRVAIDENATFDAGKSDLASMKEEGKRTLLELARRIKAQAWKIDQVQVVGHTSIEGLGNLELSSRRATTIALFLIKQGGVDPCIVTALGRGPLFPVDIEARKLNPRLVDPRDRRIELEIRPRLQDDAQQSARRGSCVPPDASTIGNL